ncbi:hypothetical protein FEM48_Zijuj07G0026400 [Ziziphus jujuba var. spinosa]|uniref:Helicase MAGATAMA 3 n=1 Tax=Ziziphus jujuba var. spinosa TaxID=714518 RepID=A0A978V1Z1_ZIZJJ|nr:hypothetical protein FEM48_Zijuj07G0026400 [Ziziphus jujuba var. spinosa]
METTEVKKERVVAGRGLIDFVFSWSLKDVLNSNFYKGKMMKIPMTFSSVREYKKSFILPLLEETHADLLSSMASLPQAPSCEIISVKRITKDYKPPKNLFYSVALKLKKVRKNNEEYEYEPQCGDVIAITDAKPKSPGDLHGRKMSYVIAIVLVAQENHTRLSILSSKPILFVEEKMKNIKSGTMFAINLINLTTNIRIWEALKTDVEDHNLNIIQQVLQTNFADVENCSICQHHSKEKRSSMYSNMIARIRSSEFNGSQESAVLSIIDTRECHHQNSVKLIWGPPGTGKTKTVGFLLHSLLTMNCRTLTCAPTNTAVLEVTERLLKTAKMSLEYGTYGLGDIVLFGNGERMKIEDHDELLDIFLDRRVDCLEECFRQYRLYLRNRGVQYYEEDKGEENELLDEISKDKKVLKNVIIETVKKNKGKKKVEDTISLKGKNQSKHKEEKEKEQAEEDKKCDGPLTYEEFMQKRFSCIAKRLSDYIVNLYTHLPTSFISQQTVKKMIRVLDSLKFSQNLLDKEVLSRDEGGGCLKFNVARTKCLSVLKSLPQEFPVPEFSDSWDIKRFCLENACLIFCTVSSSAKLHTEGTSNPLELVVIDEAAQLKECESAIPLQLPGVQHAILIGDERQLPAVVKSKISEEGEFGRSLFERLALLGHKKHLLNLQHRMHPSISLFPNEEFYENQISDGKNVKGKSYNQCFLHGRMYGSYSFINVAHGKEEFGYNYSRKNMVEVAVISEIVSSLHKKFKETKKNVRIGVISPYKAQVYAIQENLKIYSDDASSDFAVSVRSVDGFQGGEEDVIIISTVRCNGNGSVGFLSNRQRANVGLTRARYCLWVLGSAETLIRSGSVWKKLVVDAKKRRCYHDAGEDKNLAYAMTAALVDLNQLNILLNMDLLLFQNARWKVCLDDAFWRSMVRVKNNELCKQVFSMLEKLSNGWRQPHKGRKRIVHDKISSELLEHYKVNDQLYLVWTIDIIQENSSHIQVLKVLDILPLSKIAELAKQLEILFESYELDKIKHCKYKCSEGDLIVPMRWSVPNVSAKAYRVKYLLSESLAALSLSDD